MGTTEFRARFASANGNGSGSHGPTRDNLDAALRDRPDRAEETLEYLIGVERREVEPWQAVPLSTLVEAQS